MDEKRKPLTHLHPNVGIFQYSAILSELRIYPPASQLKAIGWFLNHVATLEGALFSSAAVPATIELLFRSHVSEHSSSVAAFQPSRVADIHQHALKLFDWDVEGDFSELLNYSSGPKAYWAAEQKLLVHGFQPSLLDILGVAESFMLSELPKAVRSFDLQRGDGHETAWLTTVFYRYALRALLADRANRAHLDALTDTLASPSLVELPWAVTLGNGAWEQVSASLDRLPPPQRIALRMYFGLDGPEQTIATIATELGCSEYLARTTLVYGLATVALLLGGLNLIDPRAMELLRATLLEGRSLSSAARALHMPYPEARRLFATTGQTFRRGLRERTIAHTNPTKERRGT